LERICTEVNRFFTVEAARRGFETRAGQQAMAFDIAGALRDNKHIAVEAGVGIGKTYAYLVPLMYYHQTSGKPIVISTSTIALQEQLIADIRHISSMLKYPVETVLAKGQAHFVCRKKAFQYIKKHGDKQLESEILAGAVERQDFKATFADSLWNKININGYSNRTCVEECELESRYHFIKLRDRMRKTSGFIICNHDLLTVHLQKVSLDQCALLPDDVTHIVLDEAHNLEDKVRSALTLGYSHSKISGVIDEAMEAVREEHRGDLEYRIDVLHHCLTELYKLLDQQIKSQIAKDKKLSQNAERFFLSVSEDSGLKPLLFVITSYLDKIASDIHSASLFSRTVTSSVPFVIRETQNASRFFSNLLREDAGTLFWLERRKGAGRPVTISSCPANVNEIIEDLYFSQQHRCILTSATIIGQSAGSTKDKYAYFVNSTNFPAEPLGYLSEPRQSPFPYNKHAILYYSDSLPHPNRCREAFIIQGTREIVKLLEITNGKAMVLFTSKSDLQAVYDLLLRQHLPYKLYAQLPGKAQNLMIKDFKRDTNSVLLGTGTYWEGVNIEGSSLSNLIIFRLPFPVPDPIIHQKCSRSGNPLMEVLAPEMIIKLKQGAGRLIRSYSDIGIVSILDPRLGEKYHSEYSGMVWDALPIKNKTKDIERVKTFYASLKKKESEGIRDLLKQWSKIREFYGVPQ